jgi:RNA polymerase sigma-70 factor (ECF subfamily)
MTLDEEIHLISLASQGDHPSFERLYRSTVRKVYGLVHRMIHDGNLAEELVQEIYTAAYRALPNFQGRSRFYTWIHRIAINITLQRRQSMARKKTDSIERLTDRGVTFLSLRRDPETHTELRQLMTHVEAMISRLCLQHREVIVLVPILGYSYEEAGQLLGLTPEVVKGRLHRARETLKVRLEKQRAGFQH